jgi:hypothetical protein
MSNVTVDEIDMAEQRHLLRERLNTLTFDELHAFDLQLTLLRTAFESYKRETVFKPCPTFLTGLEADQLVRHIDSGCTVNCIRF